MKDHYKAAVASPHTVYESPTHVLEDSTLTDGQKREILESWQAEAIRMQESSAEGFGGGERSHLDEVNRCLETLSR